MRPTRRRMLTSLPGWSLLGPAAVRAQANANSPSGGPGREQGGEVQAGAGTLGDVTTGSTGGGRTGADVAAAGKGTPSRRDAAAGDRPAGREREQGRPPGAPATPAGDPR